MPLARWADKAALGGFFDRPETAVAVVCDDRLAAAVERVMGRLRELS